MDYDKDELERNPNPIAIVVFASQAKERAKSEKVRKWESGKVRKKIQYHWELEVYQLSVEAATRIFELTKSFPKEEMYSLTDQIRRSLLESW